MRATNKTIFLLLLLIVSFLFVKNFNFIRAAQKETSLEVDYPKLIEDVNPPASIKTYLPRYVQYVYTFAIVCGGIIALIAFILGGFKYLASAGNPAAMNDAKNQVFSGIIGLLTILGSYIFLNELNPRITELRVPSVMAARRGIIIYNVEKCAGLGVGGGMPELEELKEGVNYQAIESSSALKKLKDKSSGGSTEWKVESIYSFNSGTELSIYFYPNQGCVGDPNYQVSSENIKKGACIDTTNSPSDTQCIKLIWRLPGVWVFGYEWGNPLEPGRDFTKTTTTLNNPYAHYQTTQTALPSNLNDKVRSIGLVRNTTGEQTDYGVILHNLPGDFMQNKGWAHVFLPSPDDKDITVYNIPEGDGRSVSSITVFNISNIEVGDEEFTLCRNPRCDPEWNESQNKYVYPQLKIKWGGGLDDITKYGCSHDGRAINSNENEIMAIKNPQSWEHVTNTTSCEKWKNIIGGLKIVGKEWKDEDKTNLEGVSNAIKNITFKKVGGVSAIYMPDHPQYQYMALLYDKVSSEPLELITKSAIDRSRSSAAIVQGNLPDLTTIRWNDRTAVFVVIRLKL